MGDGDLVWQGRICIIDVSYQAQSEGGTVLVAHARAEAGHSVTMLVHGLRPFVVIAAPDDAPPSRLESWLDDVRKDKRVVNIHDPEVLWCEEGERLHWRVDVTQPNVVPKLRELLAERWLVTSADIRFEQRLFLDLDLGPHMAVSGSIIHAKGRAPLEIVSLFEDVDALEAAHTIREAGGSGLYSTDIVIRCQIGDLKDTEPFRAPFVTASFDLETSVIESTILCSAMVIDRAGVQTEYTFQGSEQGILSGMTRLIRDEDPDILTGYNIDNFDLPRIEQRTEDLSGKNLGLELDMFGWGRDPIADGSKDAKPSRSPSRRWTVRGRAVMDAWWEARMALRPQRESLRFVSELLFPNRPELRKMDIDASRMDEEWSQRPDEVLRYCVMDTVLPIEILEAIHAIRSKEALSSVARMPFQRAVGGTTSQWIDSLMVRLADREKVAIPRTRTGPRRDQIVGGHVQDVDSGLHPWIAVLDFKSMYPSIMIEKNICFTTRIDAKDAPLEDVHFAPDGTAYLGRSHRSGLVPRLLQQLMEERDRQKEAMKAARIEDDEITAFFHDRLQFAVKILMNSFYGVFASSFYRFTHQDIGASITAWARSNIRGVIATLEDEEQRVVYGDTDSIFISAPIDSEVPTRIPQLGEAGRELFEDARNKTVEFGQSLAKRFTKAGAELEFEAALAAMFSHGAKKRYFGQVVWPEEDLLIRGYEVRRSDSFVILTNCMTSSFERILAGETTQAVEDIRTLIQRVRNRDVAPKNLVISRSCKGKINRNDGSVDFSVYANPDGLPYVKAAKQRLARGLNFTPGMKVGYLVTDATSSPMSVVDWHEDETGEIQTDFDPEYYAKRIATAMGRITEVFGWNEKELLQGSQQSSLDRWM